MKRSKDMEKVFYNKLVRDKVPQKILAKGSECEVRELSKGELEKELFKKLEEEITELIKAKENKEELEGEIADALDVIEEIMKLKNISKANVEAKQKSSLQTKGGFKKRLYLVWSSNDGYESGRKK